MAQIKIYGLTSTLNDKKESISIGIHKAVMSALAYPVEKKFHRFISLNQNEFIYPEDRSHEYIIIEISMFEGRSIETKKTLIRQLYSHLLAESDISAQDIEITIFETPKEDWGIRGKPADELTLDYTVEI